MSVEFLKSEKGKQKLCFSGHLFFKEKQNEKKFFWKCQNYRKTKCAARVTTVDNTVVETWKEHNHSGDAAVIEAAHLLDTIRTRAETTNNRPHTIISSVSRTCSPAAATQLPSVDAMKRTIRNIRKRNFNGPVLPTHRRDIVFTEEYMTSCNGELFLQFDSGPQDNRMLIFSTKRNLQLLARSEHWYADGTFKTVPLLFYQLYTIHGFKDKTSLPLVYALLPNKSEETYVCLLQQLKVLEPAMSPQSITIDFEMAMMKACRRVFPDALQRGCFFHFSQCIFRSIQSNGLKYRYETDPNFALNMRSLAAIAFVPTEIVTEVFEHLCQQGVFPPESQPVVDYFEDTWIGRPARGHRRPPKYAHEIWNVHQLVLEGLPRTNNSVEGWHRGFEQQVDACHPNIWRFIDCVKKEQSMNELQIEQYLSGGAPMKKKKKYRDCDLRISRLVSTFERNNISEYVKSIAHNISY